MHVRLHRNLTPRRGHPNTKPTPGLLPDSQLFDTPFLFHVPQQRDLPEPGLASAPTCSRSRMSHGKVSTSLSFLPRMRGSSAVQERQGPCLHSAGCNSRVLTVVFGSTRQWARCVSPQTLLTSPRLERAQKWKHKAKVRITPRRSRHLCGSPLCKRFSGRQLK